MNRVRAGRGRRRLERLGDGLEAPGTFENGFHPLDGVGAGRGRAPRAVGAALSRDAVQEVQFSLSLGASWYSREDGEVRVTEARRNACGFTPRGSKEWARLLALRLGLDWLPPGEVEARASWVPRVAV